MSNIKRDIHIRKIKVEKSFINSLLYYAYVCNMLFVKLMFHQKAKSFALGTFASPNARDSSFALPNARNTNMLVSFALGEANLSRFTRRVLPNAFYPTYFTRRQSVEYRWRWAFWRWGWRWACTFHILCVDFICVWWSMQSQYPVEYVI